MILFLSKYPQTEEDFRDGYFQRVIHVDALFADRKKVYLVVSPYRYLKKMYLVDDQQKRVIVKCNLIFCIGLILRLFKKSKTVYVHSIHNLVYLFLFFNFFKRRYVLDLHGLVPEEFALQKEHNKVLIFSLIEKFTYNKLKFVIGVTQRMINHYKIKYPTAKSKNIVYPILPNSLIDITQFEIDLSSKSEKVNFIYSGNLQAWQNIDLMLDHIKKINHNAHYFFQILTGEVENMKKKFSEKQIDMNNIDIRGVQSYELAEYYKKAHYGFVLRDNIPVNNVACPTKLVEYMNYGIIPIVLSEEIGDFKNMDYENISVDELSDNLQPKKSLHNIKIIQAMYSESYKSKSFIKNL